MTGSSTTRERRTYPQNSVSCWNETICDAVNQGPKLPGGKDDTLNPGLDIVDRYLKVFSIQQAHSHDVDTAFDSQVNGLIHEYLFESVDNAAFDR